MSDPLDPNFDQLIIICGIAAAVVIAFILFVIKLPDGERDYTNENNSNKSLTGNKNCHRNSDEDTEF
jgi:hypothetical protein